MTDRTDRPRPTPDGSDPAAADKVGTTREPVEAQSAQLIPTADARPEYDFARRQESAHPPATRIEVQPAQVVAAAGTAIVAAARVGRLLGRSGWSFARQLPGARALEREALRLQNVAIAEARRLREASQPESGAGGWASSRVEQRAAEYIRDADHGLAPLRSAMNELLERSVEATRSDSREYLYGTIISQLVPDEARILAALAGGARFAASDVVQRTGRGTPHVLLANASAIGRQAGLVSPDNVPTYLARLRGFDLVEFGPEDPALDVQYDILATDATVQRAQERVDPRRRGSVKIVRKTVAMSAFGRDFWAASDPSRPA